jgi:hypothetical protein
MNRKIRLVTAGVLGICGLMLAWGLLAGKSAQARPVRAQSLPPTDAALCDFTSIAVTAGSNSGFRISDTLPGGTINRTIYFANHESDVITISAATAGDCYVWGGAAFGRTEPALFEPGNVTSQRWITYPVDINHSSTTVILTSSQHITGSVLLPASRVVLSFVQDITPPHNVAIEAPSYTTRTEFPVSWTARDNSSGLAFYTVAYSGTVYTTWQIWLERTRIQSGIFNAPVQAARYVFLVVAYDHVGNYAIRDTATHVDSLRTYLPLVLRSHPPTPEGSITIEGGSTTTYQPSVTLALSATVSSDEVIEMRIRNTDTNWSDDDWEPFNPTKAWTLASDTSGLRTVYAQFRGSQGGVSASASDQIYLARNGGFEDGYNQTAWQQIEDPLPVDIVQSIVEKPDGSTPPAGGNYALLLGNPDYPCTHDGVPVGYGAAEQVFSLPPQAERLVFDYIVWSQDACLGITYDRFEVYINDFLTFHDGNQIYEGLSCEHWWRVPSPENPRDPGRTSGWATGEIDLSGYAGQTVVVSFRNYNRIDGWYSTYTHIDNVSVEGGW